MEMKLQTFVNPGKLALASATRNRRKVANLDAGLRRHDDEKTADLFYIFPGQDISSYYRILFDFGLGTIHWRTNH